MTAVSPDRRLKSHRAGTIQDTLVIDGSLVDAKAMFAVIVPL
jgi:hypothetical protein